MLPLGEGMNHMDITSNLENHINVYLFPRVPINSRCEDKRYLSQCSIN
jgi:hypothetical protein